MEIAFGLEVGARLRPSPCARRRRSLVQRTVCPTRARDLVGHEEDVLHLSDLDPVRLPAAALAGAVLAPPLSFSPQPAARTSSNRAIRAREGIAGGYGADLPRHLLTGEELSAEELHRLLDRALELKAEPTASRVLEDRTVALLFEHPSTRTRTSMEAGVVEMGGHPMVLRANELQLTRGESVRDTALVFSRHAAAIGLRTGSEERLHELAAHATVPVVNMLSPQHHPLQALADLMTLREAFGDLENKVLAYVGDGNNVARSLAILGTLAGLEVRVAAPPRVPAPRGPRGAAHRRSGGGGQRRARALHRRLGLDERRRGDGVAAPRGARALPARRRAARPRRAGRDRPPLPARAPRRGDHRGGALRRPPAHLGPGREPPARPEGAARVARLPARTIK